MRHNKPIYFTFLGIFLALNLSFAYALEGDASMPVHVESDDAVRDGKKELTTYRGNVVVTQGSLKLLADTVHIQTKNSKLVDIVALGNPAKLSQKPRPHEGLVKAHANKIVYNVRSQQASLEGQANLQQDGRELNSDLITYDFQRKFVEATSNKNSSNNQRVHVVIPPANNEEATQ